MHPSSYKNATVRCVLPFDLKTGRIALALNMENGDVVRVSISPRSIRFLVESFAFYLRLYRRKRCQSPISSGNPSVSRSVVPGQSQ